MIDLLTEKKTFDTAVLVAVARQGQDDKKTREYLNELDFLANTIGIECVFRFTQRLEQPDKRTFVGKGKLEEIAEFIKDNPVDVIIFDDELSPSQVRNIENELEIKVYDRSLLILDIFLWRAQTSQAKTQVELARAQYLLPRLTNMWSHLERQRGGTGTRGGSGEKELETDKRMIRNQITKLKERLAKIDTQNKTQRKGRDQKVRVALAGYTNVGKSTIMKLLSKEDVFAENKLFATIDSTVRKVVMDQIPFLLTDTVGFIRKLPHSLVECFKSTLDEIREADIIVHVVDVSHETFEEQIEVVNETLREIKSDNKPTLLVFNKLDAFKLSEEEKENEEVSFEEKLAQLEASYYNQSSHVVFMSATNQQNVDTLREKLLDLVSTRYYQIYPHYLQ